MCANGSKYIFVVVIVETEPGLFFFLDPINVRYIFRMCLKKKKNLVKPKEEISLPKKYIKCDGSQDTITKIVQRHKKFLQIIWFLRLRIPLNFLVYKKKLKKF